MKRVQAILALAVALSFASCKTSPTTPDSFFGAVVTCAEGNRYEAQATASVMGCLTAAVGGDYSTCIANLLTSGGHWSIDEIACLVRDYATSAAVRLNSDRAAGADSAGLANANDWLRSKRILFRAAP